MAQNDNRRYVSGLIEPVDMNVQMEASNAALRESFARNPVKPNAAPEPYVAGGIDASSAAAALVPPEYVSSPPAASAPSQRFDYGKAFNPEVPKITAQPIQPIAAPTFKPMVDAQALQPRGPIEQAVTPKSISTIPSATPNERDNQRFELNLAQAKRNQAYLDREAALRQGLATAAGMTSREDDLRMKHYAQKAMMAGSSALNYAWGQDTARAETNFNRAQAPVIPGAPGARGAQAAGDPTLKRNFVQEAFAEEQMREQRAAGQSARAGAAITQQTEQQKMEQSKRITEASQKLMAETDPAKREALQQSILTMMGKDPREGWKAIPISMPDRTNEMGAVMKGGQAVALIDATGKVEIVQMGDGQQASAAPLSNHVDALKKDPNLAAQFDAKYGKGAAAKILGGK